MPNYFITTVCPNGFIEKDGKHLLKLSICLDVDLVNLAETDNEAEAPDSAAYATRFGEFYVQFDKIYKTFNFDNLGLIINNVVFLNKDITELHDLADKNGNQSETKKIKAILWNNIFSNGTTLPDEGTATVQGNRPISRLARIKKPKAFGKFQRIHDHLSYLYPSANSAADPVKKLFTRFANANRHYRTAAIRKTQNMHADVHYLLGEKSAHRSLGTTPNLSQLTKATEDNLKAYVTENIDPDEFISTFGVINKNPFLKRLLGFIIDVAVEIDVPTAQTNYKCAACFGKVHNWTDLQSTITGTPFNGKYFYQLQNCDKHFEKTILIANEISLLTFDTVAQDQKLKGVTNNDNADTKSGHKADSFTRGILCMNPALKDIITQAKFPRKTKPDADGFEELDTSKPLDDTTFINGHRVAVLNAKKIFSLTCRSASIYTGDKLNPEVYAGVNEGTIHFDAVMHQMKDDGTEDHSVSDVMFEWSGQQLTLKSAFSHSSSVPRIEQAYDQQNNPGDDGIGKSQAKTAEHLLVDSYPFQKKQLNPEPKVKLMYNIPAVKEEDVIKLRFGNNYQFCISQQYKNGWGLPLVSNPKNPTQLSIMELISADNTGRYVTQSITFAPLENKKPVLLYHTKEVKKVPDNSIAQLSPEDQESLLHLIIRSNKAADEKQTPVSRHVLPERIALESAFWYDLLSVPNMQQLTSLSWKKKYNCSFPNESKYDNFVNPPPSPDGAVVKKSCPEGCKQYCGGTGMRDFYPEQFITPNFLTDPRVIGCKMSFFHDKKCTVPVTTMHEEALTFFGTSGISPVSCRLNVAGSVADSFPRTDAAKRILDIFLKKGDDIYVRITNRLDAKGIAETQAAWWNQSGDFATHVPNGYKPIVRNAPRVINLTHAVKEPLIVPHINSLYSSPETAAYIHHIESWLKRPAYQGYLIGLNIIAERSLTNNTAYVPTGTIASFIMESQFERLDAIRPGGGFLPNLTPTGALELWMKKEDFADDATQVVLKPSKKQRLNHQPDEAIAPFNDPTNVFALDLKIDFTTALLNQIKTKPNYNEDGLDNDIFRDIVSYCNLQYDFKTTKFELREYYLRDVSKFAGFFLPDTKDADAFALPKLCDVNENAELRFKVMVLNNKPPEPPSIAAAVTTIREERSYPAHNQTISVQNGNIVTIYLKRGRLTSGRDERLGLIVDAKCLYNGIFKDKALISMAGRDIVSDQYNLTDQYIKRENIVIRPGNEYDAGFDELLGIVHFLPKFDIDRQLWKAEIEFDLKTGDGKHLHNPFIHLALLHYQPFSVNYLNSAIPKYEDLIKDCRISSIDNGTWCYLLPERRVHACFEKPIPLFRDNGSLSIDLSFDYESLHHFHRNTPSGMPDQSIVRSNFLIIIEGSHDNVAWQPVLSMIKGETKSCISHPILTNDMFELSLNSAKMDIEFNRSAQIKDEDGTDKSVSYCHFRARLTEVEWFEEKYWGNSDGELQFDQQQDVMDDERLRIRYVELIY